MMKFITTFCANKGSFLKALISDCIRRRTFKKPNSTRGSNGAIVGLSDRKSQKVFDVESCSAVGDRQSSSEVDNSPLGRNKWDSLVLGVLFFVYLMVGSFVFSLYEPEMDLMKAVYFNFVTFTTIGLGDLVPKSDRYLVITVIYTTVGLSLTTIAMEIAADLLKKIHYFGRKIENVSNVYVWFGGQRMTVKNLVKHLGDQLNVPVDKLNSLNLDNFVNSAIKVEAGEMKTLRKPDNVGIRKLHPLRFSDIRHSGESESLQYIDMRTARSNDLSFGDEATIRRNLSVLDEIPMDHESFSWTKLRIDHQQDNNQSEWTRKRTRGKGHNFRNLWKDFKEGTTCWKALHPSAVPSLIDSSEDITQ